MGYLCNGYQISREKNYDPAEEVSHDRRNITINMDTDEEEEVIILSVL